MNLKTIRLRPQDQVDLEYLTLITGLTEGALIRFVVVQASASLGALVCGIHLGAPRGGAA